MGPYSGNEIREKYPRNEIRIGYKDQQIRKLYSVTVQWCHGCYKTWLGNPANFKEITL